MRWVETGVGRWAGLRAARMVAQLDDKSVGESDMEMAKRWVKPSVRRSVAQ